MTNIKVKLDNMSNGMIGRHDMARLIEEVLREVSPLEVGDWSILINYEDHETVIVSVRSVN